MDGIKRTNALGYEDSCRIEDAVIHPDEVDAGEHEPPSGDGIAALR